MIQLKGNQKELLNNCNDIIKHSNVENSKKTYTETEKNRGRIETRTVNVFENIGEYITGKEWRGYIKNIVHITRDVNVYDTKLKKYIDRSETSIYITNWVVSACDANNVIRNHWFVENKNHYVRDVTLQEDASRIRVNPENMAVIRSFALNVMRKNKVKNINGEIYENSLDYSKLYSYQQFI